MRGLFGALVGGVERKDASGTVYGSIELWRELFGGAVTRSGVRVTWEKALQVTTALRCASIIAEGIASVGFGLYRKVIEENRTRRREAADHALFDIISTAPNDWQTSFEFRETLGLHLALCNNAYVFVSRVRGQIVELIPFEPNHVTVIRDENWGLSYRVAPSDGRPQETFPASTIWHLRGKSWNSYQGLDTVHLAREALGLALATEESHARIHDKAVRPSGVLSVEGEMKEEQFLRWRKWVDAYYTGVQNAGKALILDRSATWQSQQMTGVDAEHVRTRGLQIEEICRAFGVLPIMVGYTGDKSSTYASAEQMFLAHLSFTLRPMYERVEQSAKRWLLTKDERESGLYFDFSENDLLRVSLKERGEYWEKAINSSLFTPNEGRDDFGYDAIEGLDRPRMPINYAVIGEDGLPIVPKRPPADADPDDPGDPVDPEDPDDPEEDDTE